MEHAFSTTTISLWLHSMTVFKELNCYKIRNPVYGQVGALKLLFAFKFGFLTYTCQANQGILSRKDLIKMHQFFLNPLL